MESAEGGEISMDKESQNRKPPKCTVVIVDTYTLTIVQTIFHGNLSIGPLKFMDVVSSVDDGEIHCSLLADSFGKLQLVPLSKDFHQGSEGETRLQKPSKQEIEAWEDGLVEAGQVVSIATCRTTVATVLKDRSIFRLLDGAITIGVILFMNNVLCVEDDHGQSHVVGAMFLESKNYGNAQITSVTHESENFLVWNNRGSAVLYAISYLDNTFNYEPLCEIPATSFPLGARLSFSFVHLSQILLRVESVCFTIEDSFQWKPRVTIWSLKQRCDRGKLLDECKMPGEGISFLGWTPTAGFDHKSESLGGFHTKLTSIQSSVSASETVDSIHLDDSCYSVPKGQIVSSSMVISENLYAPSAIVYGFFSGQILVVWFNLFRGLDSPAGSPRLEVDSHISKQNFVGHTGAILCLAAHRMIAAAKGWSFSQVLVSGSMDCTIRIWDLDSGNLVTVVHQHVGPVRQIILPPARTERPWSDCFLSVGEDSCVALTSLETLRVERMFPGHPDYPAKVVWDGARGYIACLCRHHSRVSDAIDVLYIWDVKTGSRERVLRGTASHSMFDHFCKEISVTSVSGSSLSGNTSVSSLLLPIHEDGNLSQHRLNSSESGVSLSKMTGSSTLLANNSKLNSGKAPFDSLTRKQPIKCFCPYPGIATLSFDLAALIDPCQKCKRISKNGDGRENSYIKEHLSETFSPRHLNSDDGFNTDQSSTDAIEEHDWIKSLEEYLVRFSLSFLHLWDVDCGLDDLLIADMKLKRPNGFIVSSGLQGDKGSLTLTFPGFTSSLELWKSSSEFCAMRSLTMVSLAQHMISLSHPSSSASSALAAFYTRNFADKYPDIKPPLLQVVNFILQTMDPGNSVMRKICHQHSMTTLREVIRVFPMVAMNESSTKLAFGDAIGEINGASIRVYDMQSATKIKVLDASGPPGLPSLLLRAPEMSVTTVISALSFSPDGEGLVAFSEHGLMIRWWSLGSVWWEKLSRNLNPVQCTKVIFVPPGEGFSPKTSRSSIMGSVLGHDTEAHSQEAAACYSDKLKLLIHNLDLSYRLQWVGERKVLLTRHGLEIGSFPL
ncbi:hypothetical protein ES288_A02G124800v1 [Gossypium darwinii]|uniref:Uncharacterized protein n=1 Tax=Gossypium darwinii TaxID=34276 RepID=A0A5D2HD93_GOSDA|nr:hypothetical protein ES288_A02G124800v1 [Gossypium darwinii]